MAAPEVTLVDKKEYAISAVVEAAEGESQVIVNLPTAVPAGKKAEVRIRVEARLVDAT